MIKYYCDKCGSESEKGDALYTLPIYVHIMNENPMTGHVKAINGEFHRMSGRTVNIDMCLPCYNETMFKLWDGIKDDVKKHKHGE